MHRARVPREAHMNRNMIYIDIIPPPAGRAAGLTPFKKGWAAWQPPEDGEYMLGMLALLPKKMLACNIDMIYVDGEPAFGPHDMPRHREVPVRHTEATGPVQPLVPEYE